MIKTNLTFVCHTARSLFISAKDVFTMPYVGKSTKCRAAPITETDPWGRVIQWSKRNGRYYREVLSGAVATGQAPIAEVSEHVYRRAAKRFAERVENEK